MKYLFLLLISFNVLAEQEFNVSFSRINQDLEFKDRIEFDMNAVSVSYSYFTEYGLGAEIAISRSTETPNTVILDTKYQNKINALWSGSIVYKYRYDNDLAFKYGVGITEYHSTWKVDGVEPAWSSGSDSHKPSYFIGAQYRLFNDLFLEASVRKMYEKMKEDKGREITYSANIGFTYVF